jgi:hypothetical protein
MASLSSSRFPSGGIGTTPSFGRLPRLHRAVPSTSLDKSARGYLIVLRRIPPPFRDVNLDKQYPAAEYPGYLGSIRDTERAI